MGKFIPLLLSALREFQSQEHLAFQTLRLGLLSLYRKKESLERILGKKKNREINRKISVGVEGRQIG